MTVIHNKGLIFRNILFLPFGNGLERAGSVFISDSATGNCSDITKTPAVKIN